MASNILAVLTFYTVYLVNHKTRGQSCFPQTWQSSGWIERFDNGNPVVRKFTTNEYSTQTYIGTIPSGPLTEYECLGTGVSNSNQYYVRRNKVQTNDVVCESAAYTSNGILMMTARVPLASPNQCPVALRTTHRAQWLPRRDLNTGTTAKSPCLISDGIYRATYTSNNQGEHCLGVLSSSITVTGATMTTDLCGTNLNNYDNPLKGSTIKCIASTQGSFLDSDDNGDILLLQNGDSGRFYCARYRKEGTKHYLSLDIQNNNTPFCHRGSKYNKHSPNIYLLLTLEKPCTVPLDFNRQPNVRWFYEYSPGEYYSQSFTGNAAISTWRSNTITETLSCINHYSSEKKNYYLMRKGASTLCYEIVYVNENIIIQRSVAAGSIEVRDCPNALAFVSTLQVLTRYTSSLTFNLTPKRCPFFDGTYHALYANNTLHDICKGFRNSTADIATEAIRVRTCTPTNYYAAPYYGDWTCYGTWRQDMTSFNSPSSGSDYLLLGFNDPTQGGRQTFFCSRFHVKINSAGYVQNYISLDVNDPNKVTCDMSKDHHSKGNVTGNQFRAFLFISHKHPVLKNRTITLAKLTELIASTRRKYLLSNKTQTSNEYGRQGKLPNKWLTPLWQGNTIRPFSVPPNPTKVITTRPTRRATTATKESTTMPTMTTFVPVTLTTGLFPITTTRPPRSTTQNTSSTATSSTGTTATTSTGSTDDVTSSAFPSTTTRNQCTTVCLNSGSCQIQGSQQVCFCQPGYTGLNCESRMEAGLCAQAGYWSNQTKDCIQSRNPNYFFAICLTGFDGSLCENDMDDCAESPGDIPRCSNGGQCQDLVNDWRCVCTKSWTGKTCETWASSGGSTNLAVIVGLIIGLAGVIVLIVIVAVILCYYKDKEAEKEKLADSDFHSESVLVSTSRAWYPDYKTDVTQLNDGAMYQ